jgi:hypothetical protein
VTVTNRSDETVWVGEGRAIVFAFVSDESRDLVLLPAGNEYEAKADCWRLTEGVAVTEEYRTVALDPGESVSQLVDLYGAAGGDACLPVGERRFEATYSVVTGRDEVAGGGDEGAKETEGAKESRREAEEWGFSILLE